MIKDLPLHLLLEDSDILFLRNEAKLNRKSLRTHLVDVLTAHIAEVKQSEQILKSLFEGKS